MTNLTNTTVLGYTLLHKLGEGGMAEVWYAENGIGKPAAIKILRKDLSHNEDVVSRFKNEVKVMVRLNHSNIRQVYDYGFFALLSRGNYTDLVTFSDVVYYGFCWSSKEGNVTFTHYQNTYLH